MNSRLCLLIGTGVFFLAGLAQAASFTLSDAALMSLDYNLRDRFSAEPDSHVSGVRDVPGPGVEFDLHYEGTTGHSTALYWVSDVGYGAGTLAGMDVSRYTNFDLKFTLLQVDGSPTSGGGVLGVGALIGSSQNGAGWLFKPMGVSFDGTYQKTAISSTTGFSPTTGLVGFCAYFPWPSQWTNQAHELTVRIEAAPGATVLPEPGSLFLLACGVGLLRGR